MCNKYGIRHELKVLSMSAFDKQRQTEFNIGKTFINAKGVLTVSSLEMRRISCLLRLSLLPEIGQSARISISEIPLIDSIKMSGNSLVSIIANDCTML
jgi:hypothetical protein